MYYCPYNKLSSQHLQECNQYSKWQPLLAKRMSSSEFTPLVGLSIHRSAKLLGCLISLVCNSKDSVIFKLFTCIMIVHTLKICISKKLVELRHFSIKNAWGCLVCVIGSSNSFHSFIFKNSQLIVHTFKMCTSYFVHIWIIFHHILVVLNLDIYIAYSTYGVLTLCNLKLQQF